MRKRPSWSNIFSTVFTELMTIWGNQGNLELGQFQVLALNKFSLGSRSFYVLLTSLHSIMFVATTANIGLNYIVHSNKWPPLSTHFSIHSNKWRCLRSERPCTGVFSQTNGCVACCMCVVLLVVNMVTFSSTIVMYDFYYYY